MTAVRVVPPTSKEVSWRPGAYALARVELAAEAADCDRVVDVDDGDPDWADVPPDEHPAASAAMIAATPTAAPHRPPLMPSIVDVLGVGTMTPL